MSDKDPTKSIESTFNVTVTRRDFIKGTAGTVACVSLSSMFFGCGSSSGSYKVGGYPIAAEVYTTQQQTIKPSQFFSGTIAARDLQYVEDYDQYGYGAWTYGDALTVEQRYDIMADNYDPSVNSSSEQLLRFFAFSDIHITDKESPSQGIYMQPLLGMETSTYSPTMLYSTHVLDAAIQTINALHSQNPIDFGISLGDACNSAQFNELRWYIDVIDGKVITPSSGAHVGAENIDYQKPFKAAGLNPEIPWYQTVGNHDHFWLGSIPFDTDYRVGDLDLRSTCTSNQVIDMPNLLIYSSQIFTRESQLYYMGVIDGTTPTGAIVHAGKVEDFSTPPTVVADPDRRPLTKAQWVDEFFDTSTNPPGHGFNLVPSGHEKEFACYSFSPKPYFKVIVLDNTQREDDGSSKIHGHAFLDQPRWDWLKAELDAGDAAGQLMIIAAHVPIGISEKGSYMEWFDNSENPSYVQNAVDLPELLAELHSHPNLLMWIAGHRHVNVVKAFKSEDSNHSAANNFWQVETSSLHDFPQQLRTFDIKLNSDYSVSIETINVDPAVKEGTPAATARKYAVAAIQIVGAPDIVQQDAPLIDSATQEAIGSDPSIRPMPTGSYNAELLVQLSDDMKTKMQALFPTL